jgi:UDP-hydrolysing UDP-N-acetyl-D-glucosamine 2-epimerase
MTRKIAVATGSRAEYGLLYWLMKDIQESASLELQILVTGAHRSPAFGHTIDRIREDGFEIAAEIPTLQPGDTRHAVATAVAAGVAGFADALQRLAPDVLVLMADRSEIFAAAAAAVTLGVPIAHFSGGESTEGLFDDQFRHAITKLSRLHFVSMEAYASRVVRMGESPSRVFVVGEPGLDHVRRTPQVDTATLSGDIGLDASKPFALVTFHPVTLELDKTRHYVSELMTALDRFPDLPKLFTYPGADPASQIIIDAIERYVARTPGALVHRNLGFRRYLSVLAHARVMVGNSSSGIVEAPSFGLPAVNIGSRQRGRVRARNVIDADCRSNSIASAIEQAMTPSFRGSLTGMANPYGDGNTSGRVVKILESVDIASLTYKPFHDGSAAAS